MKPSLEETLIEVWRQALVEDASAVELDGNRYPVRRTPKRGLRLCHVGQFHIYSMPDGSSQEPEVC